MIPGPDEIIVCPNCNEFEKYMTLMSGNTIGIRQWTDMKQIAPMLPLPPEFVKCNQCSECYWLSEAKRVGTSGFLGFASSDARPEWKYARYVREPDEIDYYMAIEKRLAKNKDDEKKLRILAWWRRNDPYREEEEKSISDESGRWRENLETLKSMVNEESDQDQLMKAEIHRELGEFEVAIQILDEIHSPDLEKFVDKIRNLCEENDTRVREFELEG